MDFYGVPRSSKDQSPRIKQGDILSPIPFVMFSLTQTYIASPGSTEFEIVDLTAQGVTDGSRILANITNGIGIVLNQTCDLSGAAGREKPIVIARVTPCATKIRKYSEKTLKDVVGHVKMLANPGRTPTLFYLPAFETEELRLPRSVADLLDTVCFDAEHLSALASLVKLRLTVPALQAFQERLAYCFGRFGTPDDLYFSEEEWQQQQTQILITRSS